MFSCVFQSTEYIQHTSLTGGSFPTEPGWLGLRELCTDPWLPSAFCFLIWMNCGVDFWCFSACFVLFVNFLFAKFASFFRKGWRDDMFRLIHGRNKFNAHPGMLKYGCKIKTFFSEKKKLYFTSAVRPKLNRTSPRPQNYLQIRSIPKLRPGDLLGQDIPRSGTFNCCQWLSSGELQVFHTKQI